MEKKKIIFDFDNIGRTDKNIQEATVKPKVTIKKEYTTVQKRFKDFPTKKGLTLEQFRKEFNM